MRILSIQAHVAVIAQDQQFSPLAGGSGWAGAGLLGLVLAWLLLRHLPDKDNQINKLNKDKDELVERIITKHETAVTSLLTTFKSEMQAERDACAANYSKLSKQHESIMKEIAEEHHTLRNHRAVVEPAYREFVAGPEGQKIPNPLKKLEGPA